VGTRGEEEEEEDFRMRWMDFLSLSYILILNNKLTMTTPNNQTTAIATCAPLATLAA